MGQEFVRIRATEMVLQRYQISSLQEAQERLTPDAFDRLMQEIYVVQQQLAGQARPVTSALDDAPPGVRTPLGMLYPVTGVILVVICAIYALEKSQYPNLQNDLFLAFGITTPDTLISGQWWRLITGCFLHLSLTHIFSNAISILWLGALAERLYGSLRYLGIYLASGIVGSLAVVLTGSVAAGASGAVFGILAAMLVGSWRSRNVIGSLAGRAITRSLLGIFLLNILFTFSVPGISVAGHVGGALAGAALSLFIPFKSQMYPPTQRLAANVASIVFIVVAAGLALYGAVALVLAQGQIG